jgi:hypothetical protein
MMRHQPVRLDGFFVLADFVFAVDRTAFRADDTSPAAERISRRDKRPANAYARHALR